jgi:hypothetical protein
MLWMLGIATPDYTQAVWRTAVIVRLAIRDAAECANCPGSSKITTGRALRKPMTRHRASTSSAADPVG